MTMQAHPSPSTAPADRVFLGTVVTMDEAAPSASAVAIRDGRIVYVGDPGGARAFTGDSTVVTDLGDGVLLPAFVEAHGHPLSEAILLGPDIVDIRPVTVASADDVVRIIRDEVAAAGPDGVYLNGWDPLLQTGLPAPTLEWLDALSPDAPLAILHNSGHSAYFNTAAARAAGVTHDTPDPVGASFGRDADGELDGSLLETGAVMAIFGPRLQVTPERYAEYLRATSHRLNAAGITTVGELGFDPNTEPLLDAARQAGALSVRLRLYEMTGPGLKASGEPGSGDALVRRVGAKLWADGSPWVGNVATSFGYLDTPATRAMGLEPGHHGHANYSPEQVLDISRAYARAGWQLACHAHGDLAVDSVLDAWETILAETPGQDRRFRLEHVGAMTGPQFQRAARLGVSTSLFIDHLYYWGDVLVDDLFGAAHGGPWAAARSALDAGIRISFHNDGTVSPPEPLRNIEIAATRRSRSGRVLAPEERITVEQALRAETIDSAYQLFSDHEVGSITVGKYADLVILGRNPLEVDVDTAPAGAIAVIPIVETIFQGRSA
jgi:predicted amidohydrolase YtcJ